MARCAGSTEPRVLRYPFDISGNGLARLFKDLLSHVGAHLVYSYFKAKDLRYLKGLLHFMFVVTKHVEKPNDSV